MNLPCEPLANDRVTALPHGPHFLWSVHQGTHGVRERITVPRPYEYSRSCVIDDLADYTVDTQKHCASRCHVVEHLVRVRRAEERDVAQCGEARVGRRNDRRHRPLGLWRLEAQDFESESLRGRQELSRRHTVADQDYPHADHEFGPQVPLLEHERGTGTERCQISWEHLHQWWRRGPDDIHFVDPEGSSQRGACEREERCATRDVAPVMVLGRGHTYDAETVWERRLASASLTGHVRDGARDDGHAMPTRDEARRQLVVTRATRII